MAVPTLSAFLERFPELAIHPVPVIEDALETAGLACAEGVWADLHAKGTGFYAAHLLDLRNREIGAMIGQPVTGISGEGEAATFYGQQYLALRQLLPITGFAF